MKKTIAILFACVIMTACQPEVGSDDWCKMLKEKPKADWSTNEAKDYAKHCIFK